MKPKTQASTELKGIMGLLPQTDKESFLGAMDVWHMKPTRTLTTTDFHPKGTKK